MERLTQQEEEVMLYFWKLGPSFIRDVLNQMPTPKPPYTSVASVVRNLEKKEYLSPFKLGNSIQYHPVIKESDYKRYFLSGVVSNYFTGSYKEMVSFFVRDRKISKKELEDLIEANDYDKIFSDYFNTFIVSQCNKVDDVVDGVPNRHGVSHSWYHSYPSKKASLNAILLTDFIIGLEPLEGTQASA